MVPCPFLSTMISDHGPIIFSMQPAGKKWLFITGIIIVIAIVLVYGMVLPKEKSVSNLYIIPAGTFSPFPTVAGNEVNLSELVIYSFGAETLQPHDVGLNTSEEVYSLLNKVTDESETEFSPYYYPQDRSSVLATAFRDLWSSRSIKTGR